MVRKIFVSFATIFSPFIFFIFQKDLDTFYRPFLKPFFILKKISLENILTKKSVGIFFFFGLEKIQLTTAINYYFSKDTNDGLVMHSKSDNVEIMIKHQADNFMQ